MLTVSPRFNFARLKAISFNASVVFIIPNASDLKPSISLIEPYSSERASTKKISRWSNLKGMRVKVSIRLKLFFTSFLMLFNAF